MADIMKQSLVIGWLFALCTVGFAQDGFQSLFNGTDLSGWEGVDGAWKVEEGAIVCTGQATKKNWLIYRGEELKNFELRLEFKFVSGNSGVQVRSKDLGDFQVQGYQVEVASQDKMGLWHHSLSPEPYRSHLATAGQHAVINEGGTKVALQFDSAEKVQQAFREGEWNELVIIAEGPSLSQIVNGQVLADLVDEDEKYAMTSGVLALQDHGKGTVAMFRNIRLKKL